MQHQSSTKVEATVFDPAPPSPIFTAFGVMLVASLLLTLLVAGWPSSVLTTGVALMLAYDLRPRRRPKKTLLACAAGSIRIPRRGLIRTRDVVGATTARTGGRVAIVLAHQKRRRTPIVIDVADEAALATICKSLGIGHNGFGHVDCIPRPAGAERARYVVNALTLAALAATLVPSSAPLGVVATPLLLCVVALVALVRVANPPAVLRLTSAGVFVPLRQGSTFIPFHLIEEVTLGPKTLVFRVRSDKETVVHAAPIATSWWARQALSRRELEHLVAQIHAAVDRAHGKFVFKPEPTLAAQLKRGKDEPIADWHARIDTIGVGAGYRATAIDAAELWSLLEDPEGDADARAAAARILSRLDRAALRVRVADVLATVRDEAVRTRIAASLEEEEPAEEREAREA